MKKVIVKAKIKNKVDFIKRLTDTGHDFGRVIFQNDRVFCHAAINQVETCQN